MRVKALILLLVLALAFASCEAVAATDEGTYSVHEYPLPANATDIGAMTVDEAGNVWLIQNDPPVIYKLVRENGTFSNYTLEGFGGAGFTGLTVDELSIVWFADPNGNRFGAYKEADNKTSTFDFPGPMAPSSVLRRGDILYIGCKEEVGVYDLRFPKEPLMDYFVQYGSFVKDIHFDRSYNVWFMEYDSNKVGVYWRTYDKISDFPIPANNSYPTCLSIDSVGRLWFVENGTNRLGMFHTELFNFSEFNMTPVDSKMPLISHVATVGDTVWLTDPKNDRVLRFYPDEGPEAFAAALLADGSAPTFIEPDADGTLWIYEAGSKKLASLDVTDQFGQVTPTPTATPAPTASPLPTKTPGFLALISIVGLTLALCLSRARK
jgi:streptogramin lyase